VLASCNLAFLCNIVFSPLCATENEFRFDHLSATGGGAAAPGVQNADAAKSPKLPAVPEEKLNRLDVAMRIIAQNSRLTRRLRLPRTLRRKLQAQMQFEEPPN
jgi:hypothetical protein